MAGRTWFETRRFRFGGCVAALVLLMAGACALPTDEGGDLRLTLTVEDLVLVVGERRQLTYTVSGFDRPGDAALSFSSSDPNVVRVDARGLMVAVGRGVAQVEASLAAFESGGSDVVSVEVIDQIAFESVTPTHVRFGEVITVIGSALDPRNLAALSVGGWSARVHSFSAASLSVPGSMDTLRVWTPAPAAEEGSLVALHSAGGSANWPLTVDQFDVFEPNNDAPVAISGPLALSNPQLSFDPGDGYDWHRIHDIEGSFTIEAQLRLPIELVLGRVMLSAPRSSPDEAPLWTVAPDSEVRCRGLIAVRERAFWQDEDATEQVLWIPVMAQGLDSVDVITEMYVPPADPVPYSITVREGYVTPYPPDEFEPNNHCMQAHPINQALSGSLSIDGPADDDWFRFTVPHVDHAFIARAQCIRCEESHFVTLSLFEDTDVGRAEAPDTLPLVETVWTGGSSPLILSRTLAPGDYFLVVHNDFLAPLEEIAFQVEISPIR